jgi:hypothetical protein
MVWKVGCKLTIAALDMAEVEHEEHDVENASGMLFEYVPRSVKRYSRRAFQPGANSCSMPPPTVQPTRVSDQDRPPLVADVVKSG